MAEYTAPGNDAVDFSIDTSSAYTAPGDDAVDFTLKALATPALSLTVVSGDDIDLSWTASGGAQDGYRVYRAEASGSATADYTQIADVGPDTTAYSDTGLEDGEQYFYRVSAYQTDGDTVLSDEQTATTALPAPSTPSLTPGEKEIALTWSVAQDDGTQAVQYREVGAATWLDAATGLSLSQTSATITGLDDLTDYEVRVVAVNDTTAVSGVATATTPLSDAEPPTLDNGIEDELTASWPDVTDVGEYRIQLQETGQSAWDASATGFAEQVVDETTTSVTFGGLEDGEAYEARLRTETEHTTGAYTTPVDAVTAFPTPANVTVASTSSTTATITWDDQADNEDGFRALVAEERFGSFGSAQLFQTLAPNTEQVTLDLRPDTTYRVTIEAFTEDAAVSESTTLTTDTSTGPTTAGAEQVPASGPHLEVDHPSNGRTLTPTITGEVAPPRALNELPTTRVPVAGDRWTADTWVGAECRLWIDGQRQPVESVVRPVQTPEGAELQLRGGEALLKRVETNVIEQEADDVVRDLLTNEAPGIAQTVDDPASTVNSNTRVLSADTTDEWTDRVPAAPYPDDDPREVTADGKVRTQRVADFQEAEDGGTNGGDPLFNDILSGGEGVTISGFSDSVQFNLAERPYPIPAGRSAVAVRIGYTGDTHPGFTLEADGTQLAEVNADTPIFGTQSELELQYTDIGGSDDLGKIAAGTTHTITIEINETASDDSGLTVDCGTVYDTDWTSATDESFSDGGPVSYPRLHPETIDVVSDDADTIQQVVGGRAEVSVTNTLRNQAIAISNDQGANWIEATNADTVEGSFASGTTNIRTRVTLSNYASGTDGQPEFDAGQAVDLVTLFADLDDAPILVDQVYDGTIESVITEIAEFADAFWEVQWDSQAGSQSVEWTFPGQRQAEGDASVVDYETSVDATEITEKAVVYGTSQSISDESVTLQHGTAVALEEQYNQPAQITVTSSDGSTTYERGSDYEYDPQAGEVTALSTGAISDGETVSVDYETRVRGVYTLPGWNGDETVARTRTIPAATTDRSARTAARILVQRTSAPATSITLTIEQLPIRWGLVEMVSLADVPAADGLEIYSIDQGSGTVSLQLGTRATVEAVVADIQTRLEATASKV